jgi:gliding motility-associated-like protein
VSFTQAPNISYPNASVNLYAYKNFSALLPTNAGGAVPTNVYGQVSTITLPSLSTQGYVGIDGPVGVAYDNSNTANNGTLVVADMWRHRIVRVNLQANTYTIIAGNGGSGYANGDGVTQAKFLYPSGVLVANNGDIYVADKENHMIRKMTLQGNGSYIVSKLAGHDYWLGFTNPGNENGTGNAAGFNNPESMAFDLNGNIIVADRSNHLIRKVTTAGVVSTIAGDGHKDLLGNGRFLDNANPLLASFFQPTDIAIASNGDIYVADRNNDRIRKITYNSSNQSYGAVSTFAGSSYGWGDGVGISSYFDKPYAIDFDGNGNLYVSDGDNNRIRKITPTAVVTTIAGNANRSLVDGIGAAAAFNQPLGICFDGTGNLFIADYFGDKIRKLALSGYKINPSLPTGMTFDATTGEIGGVATVGAPASNYTISAYNTAGVSDFTLNITVNAVAATLTYASPKVYGVNTAITPLSPTISGGVIRNSATSTPTTDYNITKTIASNISSAFGFTVDLNGNMYAGDYNGDIYKVTPAGVKTLFKSGLDYITCMASDAAGNIYVGDRTNNKIKKITSSGIVSTIAGAGLLTSGYPDYNNLNPLSMNFFTPTGIAVHTDGSIYIAESNRIFKINTQGQIFIFAGTNNNTNNFNGYADGSGTNAIFKNIKAINIDKSGNLYVADESKLRKVSTTGSVTTIADYTAVSRVISGTPVPQTLNGVAVDYLNNAYVSTNFFTILKVLQDGTSTTYVGGSYAGDADGTSGTLTSPVQLQMDDYLNLLVYDYGAGKIKSIRPNGIFVKPALPAGLSLNKYTGVVSGTPTSSSPATSYVFVAHNDFAYSTTTSNITIAAAPSLTTTDAANITPSSVVLGGNITDNGGATMLERGVVWSTTMTPTISDNKQAQTNNDLGSYTSAITNLLASTTYYVRSYITTAVGTTYGNQKTFTTTSPLLPTIVQSIAGSLINVTTTTAGFVSEITNDGGSVLTARGVCWSTTASPTVSNSKTIDGVATGTVTSTISGLNPNTKYFLRAYATNSVGVKYGNEIVFTTLGIAPIISYPSTHSLRKDVAITAISPSNTGGAVGNGIFGKVSIFAGLDIGNLDGIGTDAKFQEPVQLAADPNNNIYVADKWANRIRKVTPNAVVTTVAGNGISFSSDNTNPLLARFSMPTGIIYDPYGNIIVGDKNSSKIRRISPTGVVSTIAGNGSNYLVDGTGTNSSFSQQNQIAMDIAGNIYVADQSNHAIRKITTDGIVSTLAGNGSSGSTDGIGAAARFNYPYGIAVDRMGNVFVADRSNHKIRKITPSGVVTTFAGSGVSGFADGIGTSAKFYNPHGLTIDAAGNLYVADFNNYRIRKITPSGVVTTIAGTGNFGWIQGDVTGRDNIASTSDLSYMTGMVFDNNGSLFIAESPRILKMSTVGYSISPALPTGLSLNEQGEIVGTPTILSTPTNYTITATNAFGTSVSTFSLEVVNAGPAGLDYASLPLVSNVRKLQATNGTPIVSAVPASTGGAITNYSITPSLPTGLVINAITGEISGKPTIPSNLTNYTILATNGIGSTTTQINIEVIDAAPTNLSYESSTLVASNGSPVTNVAPTSSGGAIQNYTISPNLPAGIVIDASTGIISGTPSSPSTLTTYTITATNSIGTTTSTINIEVTGDAPIISYGTSPIIFTKNSAINSILPSITSSSSASFTIGTVVFSINPNSLPAGLSFNTNTGALTGTPTSIVASSTYTVSAINGSSINTSPLTIVVNDIAPTQLVFSASSITAAVGTPISSVSLSNSGGTVISYAVSPSLPAGLNLNSSTGLISGTPSASSGSNDYTVTASNSGGTVSKSITIVVNEAIPTNFSYPISTAVYTKGVQINAILPIISGNVNGYSVAPGLPEGLVLNATTGEISGTPTGPSNASNYVVSASNTGGTISYTLNLRVNDIAPTSLIYSNSSITATNGTYMPPALPSNTGGVIVSYAITPSLPQGLNLNTITGEISGTPSAPSPLTNYTITGTNTGGIVTNTISIAVQDAVPVGLLYSSTSIITNTGVNISPVTPTSSGGAVVSYSISPSLPNGLNFNTVTGVISGTPTANLENTVFTIVATNAAGSTSTSIDITVNVLAPSNFTYTVSTLNAIEGTLISNLSPSSSGGLIDTYTISPNLPNGLTFNTLTGVISGTPIAVSASTMYTIVATNESGAATYTLTITVAAIPPPANLTYSATIINALDGQLINSATISQTGGVAVYSITPSLPSGLLFNTSTGAITGTPSGTSSATVYTITATNNSGSASVTITIQVQSNTSTPNSPTNPILPQGSVDAVDRSLLVNDTTRLKFNFTQGVAPYKVVLSNNRNAIKDTLSNLVDGTIVSLRKIDSSTQFKIVSISDVNATRLTGFTKDTTLIKMLKPLLVLNLTAENPIKQTNGTYTMRLNLVIKNMGDVLLNNVQVDANLNNVFGSNYQFNLSNVLVVSGNARINPTYTGRGSSNIPNSVALADLLKQQQVSSNHFRSNASVAENYLFDAGTNLNMAEQNVIAFDLIITPNGSTAPLSLQFASSGSASLQKSDGNVSTQVASASSNNATNLNNHPNVTGVGAPIATVVGFPPSVPVVSSKTYIWNNSKNPTTVQSLIVSYPLGTKIAWCNTALTTCDTVAPAFPNNVGKYNYIVKSLDTTFNLYSDTVGFSLQLIAPTDLMQIQQIVGEPVLQENLTYNLPISIILNNQSGHLIDSVIVENDLKSLLPSTIDFDIISVSTTGGLIRNALYNGTSQINLTTVSSKVGPGNKDTIYLVLNINPKNFTGTISILSKVVAKTYLGVVTIPSSPLLSNNGSGATNTINLPELSVKIPEVFTPNRDGVNDHFVVTHPHNVTIELVVYNRWGSKVYSNSNYNNEWDGRGNNSFIGQELVDGGYYYTIKAMNSNGTMQIFKGFIIIQR